MVVVGNGAICSIFGFRTRDHIVVSTTNLKGVSKVQPDGTARLQAGVTFKVALKALRTQVGAAASGWLWG